jgi:hypothetical protein
METKEKSAYRKFLEAALKKEGIPEDQWETTDQLGHTLIRLPKSEIELQPLPDGRVILASLYAQEMEGDHWKYCQCIPLANLPNDLISLDDLKRFGIDVVNRQPAGGC